MCRLALQLLGMLGNVLGRPRMLCNVLGMLCNVLGRPRHAFARSEESHIEEKPPHLLSYKLWIQGSSVPPSFIYGSLVVHYFLGFTAYKTASGGFFFDVRLLGPCKSMPRSAKDLVKHAKDLAKHAEDVAKYA